MKHCEIVCLYSLIWAISSTSAHQKFVGIEIVGSIAEEIEKSSIFQNDYDFFQRVAWMESEFGQNMAPNEFGGIWRLTKQQFEQSKTSDLYTTILDHFSIDWNRIEYKDLADPIIGALAARMLYQKVQPFPKDIQSQAKLWHSFNPESDKNPSDFIRAANELEDYEYKFELSGITKIIMYTNL